MALDEWGGRLGTLKRMRSLSAISLTDFLLPAEFLSLLSLIVQVWLNAIRLNVSPIAAIVKVSGDASSGGGEY